jgi:hypothetical protein
MCVIFNPSCNSMWRLVTVSVIFKATNYVLISPCLICTVFRGLASVLCSGALLFVVLLTDIFMYISDLNGSDRNQARYFIIATTVCLTRNHWLQAVGCLQPPISEQCSKANTIADFLITDIELNTRIRQYVPCYCVLYYLHVPAQIL